MVHSRTNSAREGPQKVVAQPEADAPRTVWRRCDDRAMVEPTDSESAFVAVYELEAVAG